MKRKSIVTVIVVGALAAVAVLGALTYRTVYAQEPTPTETAPAKSTPPDGTVPEGRGPRGDLKDGLKGDGPQEQDLADALGIDLTTLQTAKQKAAEEALQQAVDKGLLTQAQADQLKQKGLNSRIMGRAARFAADEIDYNALLAKALGISVDDLKAAQEKALQAGLTRAVSEGKITQEQADLAQGRRALFSSEGFQTAMQSAFKSAVEQAVSSGAITQAQADQILAAQDGKTPFGRGGGHGRPGNR